VGEDFTENVAGKDAHRQALRPVYRDCLKHLENSDYGV
jgi:hypothetical protein